MVIRRYEPLLAQKYLDKNELFVAILAISADIETLLFKKLFFEKKIKLELIENWNLNRYINWNIELELIDKSERTMLTKFRKERNRIVHERGYYENIKNDSRKFEELKEIIREGISFVKRTEIRYENDWDLEEEY